MADRRPLRRFRRITIALDSSGLNRAAVETAAMLAASTRAEFQAVFVEDEVLYTLADLPLVREVSREGTVVRSFARGDIERDLQAATAAARAAISAAARRASIEWQFEVMRGVADEMVPRMAGEAQVLALGSALARVGRVHRIESLRRSLQPGVGVLVTPPAASRTVGAVVTMLGPDADIAAMIELTRLVAGENGRERRYVVVSDEEAECDRIAAELDAAGEPEPVRCVLDDVALLARIARHLDAGLVIADIDQHAFDQVSSVERASEAFGCPLLLVQSGPGSA